MDRASGLAPPRRRKLNRREKIPRPGMGYMNTYRKAVSFHSEDLDFHSEELLKEQKNLWAALAALGACAEITSFFLLLSSIFFLLFTCFFIHTTYIVNKQKNQFSINGLAHLSTKWPARLTQCRPFVQEPSNLLSVLSLADNVDAAGGSSPFCQPYI